MMYEEHPTYAVNSLITDNMSLLRGRGLKVLCFAFKESHMPTYTRITKLLEAPLKRH
jgi:hypothetical protein